MSSWIDPEVRIRVAPHVLSRAVDGHLVVYNPADDQVSHLDQIGAFVWSSIEAACSLGDLSEELARTFEISPETVITDISGLLATLVQSGVAELY